MDALFADSLDVEWTCSILNGHPLLVIQATGPMLSAALLAVPVPAVHLKYIFDPDSLPDLVPTTVVCYTDEVTQPLLAVDPDPLLRPLILEASKADGQWLLAFQVMVEGKQVTRMFFIDSGVVHENLDILPQWIVRMVG